MLKKLLVVLLFLSPLTAAAATTIPWQITNLTDPWIFPSAINGGTKGIYAASGINASSTSYFSNVLIGQTGVPLNQTALDISTSTNNFLQVLIHNKNSGNNASGVLVISNDIDPTSNTYYLETGCNSSGYNQTIDNSENANDCFQTVSDGALVIGTASSTNSQAAIRFTTGGLASSSIHMVLSQGGWLGIGTTTPSAMLSIAGTSTSNSPLLLISTSTASGTSTAVSIDKNGATLILASTTIGNGNTNGGLTISGGATTTGQSYFASNVGIASTSPFYLLSVGTGATSFTVDSSGFVGIGKIPHGNASYILDANGGIRLSSGSTLAVDTVTSSTYGNISFNQPIHLTSSANSYFASTGNLGIGTTTPWAELSINPTVTVGANAIFAIGSSTNPVKFQVNNGGLTAIGSSTPYALLSVHANNGDTNTTLFAIGSSTASATTTLFSVLNTGSVGVGTSSPWQQLDVSGAAVVRGSYGTLSGPAGLFVAYNAGLNTGFINAVAPGVVGKGLQIEGYPLQFLNSNSGAEMARFNLSNQFGIGTTSPGAVVGIAGSAGGSTPLLMISSSTAAFATTTVFSISSAGYVGIASSTPWTALTLGQGAITVAEFKPATTTTQVIDWKNGNQQLIQIGTAAVTIGFTNASTTGQKLTAIVCNPAGGTAGAITWSVSGLDWAGGTAPTQTTGANHCDAWTFLVTQATSTAYTNTIFGSAVVNF